jgi:hypothetical protein
MNTQGKRGNVAHTTISLRVDPDLYERFTKAAAADHRSIAGEVRFLLERRVEEFEREAA